MSWNKDEILRLIMEIIEEYDKVSDKEKRKLFANDVKILFELYKTFVDRTPLDFKSMVLSVDEGYCNDNNKFLKNILPSLQSCSDIVDDYPDIKKGYSLRRNPKEEELKRLCQEFFDGLDQGIFKTFNDLLDNNRILMGDYPFGKAICGLTFPIEYNRSSFIWVLKKGNKYNISTLVHEVAHADILNNVHSYKELYRISSSIFREVYSNVMGMLFSKYLENTKYREIGYKENRESWQYFVLETEKIFEYIVGNPNVYYDGKFYVVDDYKISNTRIASYISFLFSSYFLEIYYEDKELLKRELKVLKELILEKNDEEIIDNYNIREMYKLGKKQILRYK